MVLYTWIKVILLSGGVNDKGSNSVTALLHDCFCCICIYLLYVFILSVLYGIKCRVINIIITVCAWTCFGNIFMHKLHFRLQTTVHIE